MSLPLADNASSAGNSLVEMESELLKGIPDTGRLKAYYQLVVDRNQIDRGRRFFSQLLTAAPHDTRIRSVWIALCLIQKDYPAAMSAIETMFASSAPDDKLIDAGLSVRAHLQCQNSVDIRPGAGCISLCMIVKNEMRGLGACLNAAKGLVDEIVIVDTGSTDRTMDIARIFGARIYEHIWTDDFSAARNLSLEMATGDWVLILDADEIIASSDHHHLRHLVHAHGGKDVAFSIETRNYTSIANAVGWQANAGEYSGCEAGLGWFPSRKVRLFPRNSGVRFSYPVHELVEPMLHARGIPIVPCPIPIHHYGQLNELKNRAKGEKYFQLGYAKLDQMSEDLGALRELAVQAGQLERWTEAVEIWQRFLKKRPDFAEAYVNIASACWQMGKYDEALSHSYHAVELDAHLKEAHYNVGVSLLMLGRAQKAVGIFLPLLHSYDNYLSARFMLAAALACCGDFAKSQTHIQILESSPAGTALSMAVADLSLRLRRNQQKSYADALERAGRTLQNDNSTRSSHPAYPATDDRPGVGQET